MCNGVRPCFYLSFEDGGNWCKGLFHCWVNETVTKKNYNSHPPKYYEEKEMLALIETNNGKIVKVEKWQLYFVDTKEQLKSFNEHFEMWEEQKRREQKCI